MSDLGDLEREALRRLWAGEPPLLADLQIGDVITELAAISDTPEHYFVPSPRPDGSA